MSVRTYNPSVRVGNWIEDLCLEEDLLKDFLSKKDNGELMIQKTHNFLNTVLKKVLQETRHTPRCKYYVIVAQMQFVQLPFLVDYEIYSS